MAWLKEEHPEIMAKVYKVFQPKDYLIFRLSGEFVTDNWSARSYANTKTGKLNGEIFDFCGLSQGIAPKTYHVDEVCGVVNNEDATSLGLRKGVKIICGSSDGFAAMIASGVLAEYNLAFNSTGTSEIIGCAREVKGKLENIYIFPEGVTREKDICLGPTQSGGSSLLWLCNQVLHIPFEEMVAYAEKAESGSDGLVFLPYLCGERAPIWDSKARGCFFGLKNTHTTAEIARSVMEGVAFSVRSVIEEAGQTPAKIRLVGGGSKIPVWCQIRADVLGIPVEIVDCEEACAQGGAILAGKGVGVYSSLQEGSQKTCKIKTTYFPNPAVKGKYDKNYEVYKALYQATKHLN
jgi:xylulokinase